MARAAWALILLCLAASAQRVRVKMPEGVVTFDMEDYVAAALAGEAGGFQSEQALRAVAVAVRTFARVNRGRHSSAGYDFCETTHCQDLRVKSVNAPLRRAAEDTAGIVLWADGRPARVFYHAHCGGHTESAGVLWKQSARPWLRGMPDLSCGASKWTARITAAQLGFHNLEVLARSASGRVTRLRSENGILSAGELHRAVGRALGWDLLRSTLYDVRLEGDVFLFEGRGRGHGVGLCQTGAEARGKAGASWEEILAFYFPGTQIRRPAWTKMRSERLELEAASESDGWVLEHAMKAMVAAERRAGRKFARPPRLRAYPSVQLYRDETGEPGFVLASTRRGFIRIQPPAKLRSQGVLDRTLLHEMLHVLLTQNGERIPLWEEEGRVMLLAGDECAPAALAKRTEAVLVSPRSEAQLRTAYANACSAVRKKLAPVPRPVPSAKRP